MDLENRLPLTKQLLMERPIPARLAERLAQEMRFPTKLSERETDVPALVACGYTAPAIAGLLHISHWTVGSHQKRIRMKLNAKTMAHAVALALLRDDLDRSLIE